jgi:gliding motility-associated-like protein
MSEKDIIKDLFSDKLNGLESQVRPELWGNISSQLGSASATSGISVFTKVALGITAAASVAVVGYFIYNGENQAQIAPSKTEVKLTKKQEIEEQNTTKSTTVASEKVASVNEDLIEQTTTLNEFMISFDPEKEDYIIGPETTTNSTITTETLYVDQEINVEVQLDDRVEKVAAEPIQTVSAIEIILPNTFTPNGDGVNEVLKLDLPLDKIKEGSFSCVVIDRFGKTVYQTTDINFQWDGLSMSGDAVGVGDYVYYITAEDQSGLIISKYSMLHIVR